MLEEITGQKSRFFKVAKNFSFFVFIFLSAMGLRLHTAQAATLYISPSSGTHSVGSNVTVGVYVGSADQAMNAAEGAMAFSKDTLQVTAVSKSGSIINLWTQEPSFSNSAGNINFSGIVFNPGYAGSAGKLFSITFKVKSAGTGSFNFASGSVLANDGQGTNILSKLGTAHFDFEGAPASPPPPQQVEPPPAAPVVTVLDPPHITSYPRQLRPGETMVISGMTYPNSLVTLFVQNGEIQSYTTHSNEKGEFTFAPPDIPAVGVHQAWAIVINEQGVASNKSEEVTIVVKPWLEISQGEYAIIGLLLCILLAQLYIIFFAKNHEHKNRWWGLK